MSFVLDMHYTEGHTDLFAYEDARKQSGVFLGCLGLGDFGEQGIPRVFHGRKLTTKRFSLLLDEDAILLFYIKKAP